MSKFHLPVNHIEINCIVVAYLFDNKRNENVKWYNFTFFLKLHQLTSGFVFIWTKEERTFFFGALMKTVLAWVKIQQQKKIWSWTNVKYNSSLQLSHFGQFHPKWKKKKSFFKSLVPFSWPISFMFRVSLRAYKHFQ